MSYNDLHKGRYSETNRIYFLTINLADRKQNLFRDFHIARLLIRQMRFLHDTEQLDSLAWVIMPDHMHWLVQLKDKGNISSAIKKLKGRTAQMINQRLQRQGDVWQKSFYDHALRKEEDIKHVARYIVANPLRAGLVKSLRDYPHWDAVWL